jgi:4a-hydroxytetrahydrobiopterin dehydratase
MSDQWQERNKPSRLEGRYVFEDYSTLRDFLERAAELSEHKDYFPDMGFGKDYVNITIYADSDNEKLADTHRRFAQELDKLLPVRDH